MTEPTDDHDEKAERVRSLAAAVADRARRKGALYRTIGIKLVEPPYEVHTRARSLPGPVDEPTLVEEVALDLLAEFDDTTARKLGVRVSNLSFAEQAQANLDSWEPDEAVAEGTGDDGAAEAPTDPAAGGAGHGWRPSRPVQTSLSDFL